MSHAIVIHDNGGPEVLRWEVRDVPAPAAGELRVRHAAIGLNFVDTYYRSGLYPAPLPTSLGTEAAGVVEAVGEGVTGFAEGDRVAYATGPLGAYAEVRNVPANVVVHIPDAVDDRTAAAVMLKGMTAEYLVRRTFEVRPEHTVLVHAAAGGVGLLLTQWAKSIGATVIGTVGSEEKAALARAHGCDHVLLYRTESVAERVRELTGGKGVHVVYDAVGRDTWNESLDALRPRGLMVSFGQSSGTVGPIDPRVLAVKGSLFLTRPTLFAYVAERSELEASAAEVLGLVSRGVLRVNVAQTYALSDAEQAHRDLEGRKTTGSTVLLP